jgi:hypothetical protein
MRQKILKRYKERVEEEISSREQLRYLKTFDAAEYVDTVISIVYLYTRPKKGNQKVAIYFTEVISAIGHSVRTKLKQKRDSSLAAKTGAFFLYTFEELGMIQIVMGASANGHGQYVVKVIDDDEICKLWTQLASDKIEKLPSEIPYAPWTSSTHAKGQRLVKTGNRDVLESLTPETHPMVFESVNRAQSVGWQINKEIYDIHLWALRNKTDAFAEIWELASAEAKTTKLREAHAIGSIAKRFLGKTFYH